MAAMQRDYFWPTTLSDRQAPSAWEEGGASDMWQRANVRVRDILEQHKPDYLGDEIDQRIRRSYNIRLDNFS